MYVYRYYCLAIGCIAVQDERVVHVFCVNKIDCLCVWMLLFVSERVKLKRTDYPLVLRIIQGPCEQVCKVFLMEEDLGEEVTYDVNQNMSLWFRYKHTIPRKILCTLFVGHPVPEIFARVCPVKV